MTDTLAARLQEALGANFAIERELGGGGMSRVFVATERALNRRVVVKVLPPDLAAGVNKQRFRQEIQLAAQLQHPHVVPLLTAGEHGDLLWFTMPFIEGESLRAMLDRRRRLPPREVLRLLHDVVDALAYAHGRGVMHRDIKPGNILMSGAHAMVTDFGVAKALSAAIPLKGHTTSGMAIGTPAYMAPEQLAADPAADHRVDIYAVGLLAYELLTGTSPFAGQSPQATLAAQLTERPTAPNLAQPDIPQALSDVVMRCLEKDADRRPATASVLLEELDAAAAQMSGERAAPVRSPARPALLLLGAVAVVAAITVAITRGGNGNGSPGQRPSDSLSPPPETVLVFKEVPVGRDAAEGVPFDVVLSPAESLAFQQSIGSTQAADAGINRDSLIAAISKLFADSMAQAIARMEAAFENQPRQQALQRQVTEAFAPPSTASTGAPEAPPGDQPPPSAAGRPPVPRTAADSARFRAMREAELARLETITPVMEPPPPGTRRLAVLPLRDRSRTPTLATLGATLMDSINAQLQSARRRLEVVSPEVTVKTLGERPGRPTAVGFALRANYVLAGDYFVRNDSLVLVTLLTDVQGGSGTRVIESVAPVSSAGDVVPPVAQWVRARLDSLRRDERRSPRFR